MINLTEFNGLSKLEDRSKVSVLLCQYRFNTILPIPYIDTVQPFQVLHIYFEHHVTEKFKTCPVQTNCCTGNYDLSFFFLSYLEGFPAAVKLVR